MEKGILFTKNIWKKVYFSAKTYGKNILKVSGHPVMRKILILPKFGLTCQKMAISGQNRSFLDFAKNSSNKFSKIALKVGPKIVL